MPMQKNVLAIDLAGLFESNPDLFVRSDGRGNDKPNGECWRVRGEGGAIFYLLRRGGG